MLFLLCINDFSLCLHKSESGHFADNTLFGSNKLGTFESVVNYGLVLKWLRLNKLSLNAGKTKLKFFRSKQHSLDYENISIKFNGIKLNPVEQVKYLGIYIDKYFIQNTILCSYQNMSTNVYILSMDVLCVGFNFRGKS